MPEDMVIPVASLLVDELNPRLTQPSSGQKNAIRALAIVQGRKLQALAEDIVEHGLSPGDLTIVMPFGGGGDRYVVLDGNRRLTALRVLEIPDLLADAVPKRVYNAIRRMAATYRDSPIKEIHCVVFDNRDEANHWIELRNAGERGGAGPVQWGSDETDRFRTRTGGQANFATQVLDFLEKRNDITLARIHRWTRMDGVRTAEEGEGVTGAMVRARIRVDGRLAAVAGAFGGADGGLQWLW